MTEDSIAPLDLAKSALALLQDGSDSEDEVLALSLVTSAIALHLLKQPNNTRRRQTIVNNCAENDRSRSPTPEDKFVRRPSPQPEVQDESVTNSTMQDKFDECTSSGVPIGDFKIEVAPVVLLSEQTGQFASDAPDVADAEANSEMPDQSDSGMKRKRPWSKFEDERRRVLLRLSSADSIEQFCAEPKITDYMSIFLDGLKMDIGTFNLLHSLVRKDIEHQNSCMRMSVASEQRLAVALRYLSTGESYNSIERNVKVSRSFLCVNMPLVCKALWTNLKESYLKLPTCEDEWARKAEEFDNRVQFPLCLGVLTRRHFRFKNPRTANVLALVDANSKFLHVDIEKEDEGVYLSQENAPPPQTIGNNRILPYVFLAESGFDLDDHIMTPFGFPDTVARREFNERLATSAKVSEHAFRLLVNRFKILSKPLNLLQHHIEDVIRGCSILHNFLMENNPELYSAEFTEDENVPAPEELTLADPCQSSQHAEAVREDFAEYFAQEGAIHTFDVKMLDEEGASASNALLDVFSF